MAPHPRPKHSDLNSEFAKLATGPHAIILWKMGDRLSSQTPPLKTGTDQGDSQDYPEQNGGTCGPKNDEQHAQYDAGPEFDLAKHRRVDYP